MYTRTKKDVPYTIWRQRGFEEAKKTNLQVTRFWNGLWLDYYASPSLKSYMKESANALDIANRMAGIPGDGNQPVVFTYSYDVARFLRALLDEPEWPETSIVIGNKITWNEFVKKAEEARGTSIAKFEFRRVTNEMIGGKFEVHYDTVEKLKIHQVTELPSHHELYGFISKESIQRIFAVTGQWMVSGAFDLPDEDTLNKMFPDIETLTVESMLEKCWKGK